MFLPKLLNMSLTASVVILIVLLLRLLLRKAPKVITYALWSVVLFRLLCPISLESYISVFSLLEPSVTQSSPVTNRMEYLANTTFTPAVPIPDGADTDSQLPVQADTKPDLTGQIASFIWAAGVFAMAVYSLISYIGLRRKLITASPLGKNIFLVDSIPSPFVMGLLRPRIYLPSAMDDRERPYVILHEQHHIRRLDHWVKALSFLALCLHWFNPLVWLAFLLAGRDMEMSCDEAVIRKMGEGVLADYTASLLSLATGTHVIAGMPLAFGEGDPKGRIRNLANWRRPAFWVVLTAIVCCIIAAICLVTNPSSQEELQLSNPQSGSYAVSEVTYESPNTSFISIAGENTPAFTLSGLMELESSGEYDAAKVTYLGILRKQTLTKENFDSLFVYPRGDGWQKGCSAGSIRRNNANAWILTYQQSELYYFLQQKNGDIYLARGYYDHTEKDDPYSDDTTIFRLFKMAIKSEPIVKPMEPFVTTWYDSEIQQQWPQEFELAEFPGVTFRRTHDQVAAIVDDQINPLYHGMPVWNLYTCDLNGDGLRELCSGVSMGSGIIDNEVIVYDYANRQVSILEARMKFDYTLALQSGILTVTKTAYGTDRIVETGYLTFQNGLLEIQPISPFSDRAADLDTAITQTILERFEPNTPDGCIRAASHVILDSKTISGTPLAGSSDHITLTKVSLLVQKSKYSYENAALSLQSTVTVPVSITFAFQSNAYTVKEYWESDNWEDISEQFPAGAAYEALNHRQAYAEDLDRRCRHQALATYSSANHLDM